MSGECTGCAGELSWKVRGIRDSLFVCSSPTWWLAGRLSGDIQKRSASCFASFIFCGHLSVGRDKVCGQEDRQGRWKVLSILPNLVSVATAIFSYPLPKLPTKDIRWTYYTLFYLGGREGKSRYGAMLSVRLSLSWEALILHRSVSKNYSCEFIIWWVSSNCRCREKNASQIHLSMKSTEHELTRYFL